jgi:hypothetical protein
LRRQAKQEGLEDWKFLPRTLFAMEARLGRVLDLTSPEVLPARLAPGDLRSDDWGACQAVARAAREQGFEAIFYPSATGRGENLAIFADRLLPSSYVRIVNEDKIHP